MSDDVEVNTIITQFQLVIQPDTRLIQCDPVGSEMAVGMRDVIYNGEPYWYGRAIVNGVTGKYLIPRKP